MDVYTAINNRRTIRDFADKMIDMNIIEKIINAGLKAPTNDHLRNWEFVVINDKNVRAEILQIIPQTIPQYKDDINNNLDAWGMIDVLQRNMYLEALPKQYAMLYNAGCLILPFFQNRGLLLRPTSLSSLNEFASMWCCLENMLLAAVSEGIFGVTRIPMQNESERIKSIINHPDDYVLPCYLALGYPATNAVINSQKEVSVKDKIHINLW